MPVRRICLGVLAMIVLGCGAPTPPSAKLAGSKLVYTSPSGIRFVLIEGGEFLMGGEFGEPETPQRAAVSSFWMAETLMTNRQVEIVLGKRKRPSSSKSDEQPANGIVYADIQKAIQAFRKRDGLVYDLPTEAQWEFTARSGLEQKYFPWGNSPPHGKSQVESLVTSAARDFAPNAFGIYDSWGNLSQLVREAEYTPTASYFAPPNPVGPLQGDMRLIRGGGHSLIFMPLANRLPMPLDDAYIWQTVGFRLVLPDGASIRDRAKREDFEFYRDQPSSS